MGEKTVEELRKELEDVHGTPCEMYSRIVGFYRSVRGWNVGKAEEYKQRKEFMLPAQGG